MIRLHHIGVATSNIKELVSVLELLFETESSSGIIFDSEQQASLCMIKLKDGTNVELVQGERVKNLVRKGAASYHICFSVANIELELKRFVAIDGIVVVDPKPAVLFAGKKVAFLQTSMGLIELIEED